MYTLMCVYGWICINMGCRVLWFKTWARVWILPPSFVALFLKNYLTSFMWPYHLPTCTLRIIVSLFEFEKGMATHFGIPAWRIPWTEEPGGLQSMALQRVGHDWANNTHTWDNLFTFKLLLGYSWFIIVFFIFIWSIIALQCHVGFCSITAWIAICVLMPCPSWASLHLPHPIPLGNHRALNWAPCAI